MMTIDHVNLGRLDLNLLVALDALLTECSVTRAASRVGLGQSAMSYNLARLRQLFDDEILTRGPNGMRPTPLALARIMHEAGVAGTGIMKNQRLADRVKSGGSALLSSKARVSISSNDQ
jgi:Bacterial regulatory helix-turn-helix protein, lysR family